MEQLLTKIKEKIEDDTSSEIFIEKVIKPAFGTDKEKIKSFMSNFTEKERMIAAIADYSNYTQKKNIKSPAGLFITTYKNKMLGTKSEIMKNPFLAKAGFSPFKRKEDLTWPPSWNNIDDEDLRLKYNLFLCQFATGYYFQSSSIVDSALLKEKHDTFFKFIKNENNLISSILTNLNKYWRVGCRFIINENNTVKANFTENDFMKVSLLTREDINHNYEKLTPESIDKIKNYKKESV